MIITVFLTKDLHLTATRAWQDVEKTLKMNINMLLDLHYGTNMAHSNCREDKNGLNSFQTKEH